MSDLVVQVGADLSDLQREFRRAAALGAEFSREIGRATATLPTPTLNTTVINGQGVAAGRRFAAGIAAGLGSADPFARLNASILELGRLAGELNLSPARRADVAALTALIAEQRELAAAMTGSERQVQALDAALARLGASAGTGSTGLASVNALLATLEQRAQAVASGPGLAGAAGGAGPDVAAARALAAEAERAAAVTARAAAQEQAARAQAAGELRLEIQQINARARAVDLSSATAVAAWREESAAIRQQAVDLRLPREALVRLDGVIQSVENRYRRAQIEAARLNGAVRVGDGGFPALTRATGQFTATGGRAANAAIAIAFGLESVATASGQADSGLRTALRAAAALGPAFGAPGLIASGLAAATAAVIDLAKQTDAATNAAKQYRTELEAVTRTATAAADQVRNLTVEQATGRRLSLLDQLQQAEKTAKDVRKEVLAATQERGGAAAVGSAIFGGDEAARIRTLNSEIRAAREQFVAGRITAEQFGAAIARVGTDNPNLAGVAQQLFQQVAAFGAAQLAAENFGAALQQIPGQTRAPGTALVTQLQEQIALQRQLNGAQSAGNVAERTALTTAAGAFREWQSARAGAAGSTLTFTEALRSSNTEVRDNAQAILRDARALAQLEQANESAARAIARVDALRALGAGSATQAAAAAVRAEYTRVAAAVAAQGGAGRANLELLQRQVQLAAALREQLQQAAQERVARLTVAVALNTTDDALPPFLAALREQYATVAAEVAAQGGPQRANVELLQTQVALAQALAQQLRNVAAQAGERVTLAPALGLDPAAQQQAAVTLRARYADVVTEIARQGGPGRASVELLQLQVRLAQQLGETYRAALAPRVSPAAALVQPPDPRVVTALGQMRDALAAVAAARDALGQGSLTGDATRDLAADVARQQAFEQATRAAAQAQGTLAATLAASNVGLLQRRGILDALDTETRAAGTSTEALAAQLVKLGATPLPVLVLPPPVLPTVNLPPVKVPVVPDFGQVRITPDQTRAIGPLLLPVRLAFDPAALFAGGGGTAAAQTAARVQVEAAFRAAEAAVAREQQAAARLDLLKQDPTATREVVAATRGEFQQAEQAAEGYRRALVQAVLAGVPLADQPAVLARIKALFDGIDPSKITQAGVALRSIATGVRGVTQIADAFGGVDDSVRRSIDGVANLVTSIADARALLASLKDAGQTSGIGQLFKSAEGLGSVVGAIGGAAGLIGSLLNRGPNPQEIALKANNDALDRVRGELLQLRNSFADLNRGQALALRLSGVPELRPGYGAPGRPFGQVFANRDDLDRELKKAGSSFIEFNQIAKANGIELLDSKGRLVASAFGDVVKVLDLVRERALQLDQSFAGLLDRQRAYADIFDLNESENPAKRLAQSFGEQVRAFQEATKGTDLAHVFDNLDLSTAQGRALAESILRNLYTQATAGSEAALALLKNTGFASAQEFIDSLVGMDHSLDEFRKATNEAAAALGNIPPAFKRLIDRERFGALAPQPSRPVPVTVTAVVPQGPAYVPMPTLPRTSPSGTPFNSPLAGGTTTPVVVNQYQLGVGSIVVVADGDDPDTLLDKIDGAVRRRALAQGGALHPAAQGIVNGLRVGGLP